MSVYQNTNKGLFLHKYNPVYILHSSTCTINGTSPFSSASSGTDLSSDFPALLLSVFLGCSALSFFFTGSLWERNAFNFTVTRNLFLVKIRAEQIWYILLLWSVWHETKKKEIEELSFSAEEMSDLAFVSTSVRFKGICKRKDQFDSMWFMISLCLSICSPTPIILWSTVFSNYS